MELFELKPVKNINDNKWFIANDRLNFYNYETMPVAFIGEHDVVWVYANLSIKNAIITLLKHLQKSNINFYLIPPKYSNPKESQSVLEIVHHYFFICLNQSFLRSMKSINFDIIKNLIDFCYEYNCIEDMVGLSSEYKDKMNDKSWGYGQWNDYTYADEVRIFFRNIDRKIKIDILTK
jgi:hypothetical protein